MTDQQQIQQLKMELKKLQKDYDNKPFTIEGEILFINPKLDKSVTAGKNFFVRELCLEITETVNGTPYTRHVGMQLTGNSCDFVESLGLAPKDTINVYFSPKGNVKDSEKMVQDPNNPGNVYPLNPESKTCFTNLNVYKIEPVFVANPPSKTKEAQPEVTKPEVAKPETKKLTPQPEGKIPNDKDGKPMVWNEETASWDDDLPF